MCILTPNDAQHCALQAGVLIFAARRVSSPAGPRKAVVRLRAESRSVAPKRVANGV